jgi:hypothetical protein
MAHRGTRVREAALQRGGPAIGCPTTRPAGAGSRTVGAPPLQAELKHGRVCMLAFVGWIAVDLGNTWPGAPKVSSLMAHDEAVNNGNMLALLLAVGLMVVRPPPPPPPIHPPTHPHPHPLETPRAVIPFPPSPTPVSPRLSRILRTTESCRPALGTCQRSQRAATGATGSSGWEATRWVGGGEGVRHQQPGFTLTLTLTLSAVSLVRCGLRDAERRDGPRPGRLRI